MSALPEQPFVVADVPGEPEPRPAMVDDRTPSQRLSSIQHSQANLEMVFEKEIASGKECLMHPRIIADMAFLLQRIEVLERQNERMATALDAEPSE